MAVGDYNFPSATATFMSEKCGKNVPYEIETKQKRKKCHSDMMMGKLRPE